MRTLVLVVLAAAVMSAAGATAATTADWTLVLDGTPPYTTTGKCPGPMTVTVMGSATSSEHGFGTFTSQITVTFSGSTVTQYEEDFTATVGGVNVSGRTELAPGQTYTGSCSASPSLQGTMATAVSSPSPRSGSSKVVLDATNHLNHFTAVAPPASPDNDGDGFNATVDCNDSDATIRPGAREIPGNAVDENCDGVVEPAPRADADGDGFDSSLDCNDANASIRPGAREVPGNAVDENCDGVRAPLPPVGSSINASWRVLRTHTIVVALDVLSLPARTTVTTRCEGRCPFRSRTRRVSKGTARIRLEPLFRRARLRPGTVIEIRITAPAMLGKLVRYTVRRGALPTSRTLCAPPGSRPKSC